MSSFSLMTKQTQFDKASLPSPSGCIVFFISALSSIECSATPPPPPPLRPPIAWSQGGPPISFPLFANHPLICHTVVGRGRICSPPHQFSVLTHRPPQLPLLAPTPKFFSWSLANPLEQMWPVLWTRSRTPRRCPSLPVFSDPQIGPRPRQPSCCQRGKTQFGRPPLGFVSPPHFFPNPFNHFSLCDR